MNEPRPTRPSNLPKPPTRIGTNNSNNKDNGVNNYKSSNNNNNNNNTNGSERQEGITTSNGKANGDGISARNTNSSDRTNNSIDEQSKNKIDSGSIGGVRDVVSDEKSERILTFAGINNDADSDTITIQNNTISSRDHAHSINTTNNNNSNGASQFTFEGVVPLHEDINNKNDNIGGLLPPVIGCRRTSSGTIDDFFQISF